MCGGCMGVATHVDNDKSIYVHCCGHVLSLALVDTAKQITPSRNTLGIISQLHTLIDGSAERHAVFESLQTEAGLKTITLKSLNDARWSCGAEALKSVKKCIEELINTLDDIADSDVSNGAEAHALSK
uniref:Uncharacterized protein n=1 Tax=Amphimedon queenslandica TaxID=400682 RepID=A0A1X7SKM1_AMPQE